VAASHAAGFARCIEPINRFEMFVENPALNIGLDAAKILAC